MRDIQLVFHECDLTSVLTDSGIPSTDFFKTLGYLTTWGADSYKQVAITVQKDGEMAAYFTDTEHTKKYFIAAIWHGDHYGCHS